MKKMTNKKGFTLMEMLIVVAIIAILVAIAIPTFSNALKKAEIAKNEANLRAYYAETIIDLMLDELDEVPAQSDVVTALKWDEDTAEELTWTYENGVLTIKYHSVEITNDELDEII